MPVFHYRCLDCESSTRRLKPLAEGEVCAKCGAQLVRDVRGPTTQVVEVLDNGAMAKRVERLADAERLYAERAKRGRDPG